MSKTDTPTALRYVRRTRIATTVIQIRCMTARDVFELLLDRAIAKQTNELRIEQAHRKAMALTIRSALIQSAKREQLDKTVKLLSDRTIKEALSKLVKAGLIERYGKGLYRISADKCFIGNSEAQIKTITGKRLGDLGEKQNAA